MQTHIHKVSIIIPAYNEEKCLPICLDSISNLDWPEDQLEVIVVDNGSQDRTCEIAQKYKTILLQDKTKTVAGLRNLGADRATGSILAFVDADCIVSTKWLVNSKKYFDDSQIAAWGSPPDIPENSTWVQRAWFVVRKKTKEVERVEWLESMNLFTRKNLFIQAGCFDESLITCEDVDFSYRIADYGRIISDKSLKVVHLGEADTIKIFIKKEIWRGTGNFKGVFNHGITFKELPSLAIPIYFGIFVPLLILFTLINQSLITFSITAMFLILPGVGAIYKVRKKQAPVLVKLQLFFLLHVYFIARTVAVVKPLITRSLEKLFATIQRN